jgi:uncharacterized protein YigE (DUF2233 family)
VLSPRASISSLVVAILLVLGALFATRGAHGPQWRPLQPGLDFATLSGAPYCRRGSIDIAVLRIDPRRFRIAVRHYSTDGALHPVGILEWQQRTGAVAVFNAGQYYPDFSYMGMLVSAGRVVSSRQHPEFQAALVAEPREGREMAHVLDLKEESLDDDRRGWQEVAQSFMLFDRKGTLRVRRTDRVANRTIVGEDRHGRLLAITTEGGYTLWEIARLLRDSPLGLTHAMCMDGGAEAKLCIKADRFTYASFGPWDGGHTASAPGSDVALPAVIAVMPR